MRSLRGSIVRSSPARSPAAASPASAAAAPFCVAAAACPAGGAPAAGRFGSDSTCVSPPPVGRSGPQNRLSSNVERYRFYTRPVALASGLFGRGHRAAVTARSQHGHRRTQTFRPASASDRGGLVTADHVSNLDRNWRRLVRGVLPQRLRAWARSEPALAAFPEPARLIAFLRSDAAAASKDALLLPLVRIARDEPLAARVVLEALAPGLARLAERVIFEERDRDELWALILGHAWQQIRQYPLERRPRKIAANLILETRRAALAEFTRDRRRRRELPPRPLSERAAAPASADVDTLLARAVAARAISTDEAELILQTRIDELPLRQLAAEHDVAYHTLNVRRLRAERRLLLFLRGAAVTFRQRKAHWSGARAVDAMRTGRTSATRTPRR